MDKFATTEIENELKLKCLSIHLAKLKGKCGFSTADITQKSINKYLRIINNSGVRKEATQILNRTTQCSMQVTTYLDTNYPSLLKRIPDPPLILFSTQRLAKEEKLITAVGTREPSPAAVFYAERVSSVLGKRGFTLVSGLARGIDQSVHRGSMETGKTIAVLAQGLDLPISPAYEKHRNNPRLNLISEYPPGTSARKFHFPRRNRILAGLSPSTLFIEGNYKRGAIITANLAADYGRDVFAVLHSSFKKKEGALKLISEGAGNLCKSFKLKKYNRLESEKSLLELIENKFCYYLGQGQWQLVKPRVCQQSFEFFD